MQFLDLVFLSGAGGPGNPCYRVEAHLGSEFSTSLSKVLILWHFVKVKQRYHRTACQLLSDILGTRNPFFRFLECSLEIGLRQV